MIRLKSLLLDNIENETPEHDVYMRIFYELKLRCKTYKFSMKRDGQYEFHLWAWSQDEEPFYTIYIDGSQFGTISVYFIKDRTKFKKEFEVMKYMTTKTIPENVEQFLDFMDELMDDILENKYSYSYIYD